MSKSRTRLTRKNSHFPPALRSAQGSRLAQGNAWQKCDFAALYYTFFWVQRHAATRLTRKNSLFPPALRSVQGSHLAQGNAWQKCDFAALYYTFFGCSVTLPLALPAKIHAFRLRYAPRGTVVPLKVTLGKSVILPRFIELFNKRGLTRSPQRLRCAALRLYEQTFHALFRRAAV